MGERKEASGEAAGEVVGKRHLKKKEEEAVKQGKFKTQGV